MKINEIFYSIQGEGHWSGSPAVFVRFSGCNLFCPFCDTKHWGGQKMSAEEILQELGKYPCRFVVLTGGEPSLQVKDEFITLLHQHDYYVACETNGTRELPSDIDWITLSPKDLFCKDADIVIDDYDEVKVVFDGKHDISKYERYESTELFLQPCDTGNKEENEKIITQLIDYVKEHPQWRISLQTQKILNVR